MGFGVAEKAKMYRPHKKIVKDDLSANCITAKVVLSKNAVPCLLYTFLYLCIH